MISGPGNIRCCYGDLGPCHMRLPPRGGTHGRARSWEGSFISGHVRSPPKEVDVFYIVEIGIDISSVFVILSYCIRLGFRRKVLLCIHIGVIILYTFRLS